MKKIVIAIITLTLLVVASTGFAGPNDRLTSAKYRPVIDFVGPDATLSKWFRQYVDTTNGGLTFNNFLKKLSTSEILYQRSNRAGLEHNQLYAPIIALLGEDWKSMDKMDEKDLASIKISMMELDIALAAVDATLPSQALEEFRREVLRGAKPLTEVAKVPRSATDVMTFTIMDHKLSDRLNKSGSSAPVNPPINLPERTNPRLENPYNYQ